MEKELADKEKLQLEAEGWEAEATRLAAELEGQQALVESAEERAQSAELALEVEKGKKKRYKDLGAKLRCELLNRKWKEKWELCMMDMADRDRDANEVRLEAEIAMLRLQAGLARLDKEELEVCIFVVHALRVSLTLLAAQELTSRQATSLSELTASRELLLASYKGAETIIATLRSELATAHKDSSKDASALKKELTAAKSALKSAQAEVERLGGVEREVEGLRGEVEELRRGEKVGEGKEKEVGEARKALEKEKGKREKAEADAKDLKVRSHVLALRTTGAER